MLRKSTHHKGLARHARLHPTCLYQPAYPDKTTRSDPNTTNARSSLQERARLVMRQRSQAGKIGPEYQDGDIGPDACKGARKAREVGPKYQDSGRGPEYRQNTEVRPARSGPIARTARSGPTSCGAARSKPRGRARIARQRRPARLPLNQHGPEYRDGEIGPNVLCGGDVEPARSSSETARSAPRDRAQIPAQRCRARVQLRQ